MAVYDKNGRMIKSSFDNNRIYQCQFDYIITDDSSVEETDDRIFHELELINGIILEGNPGINNDSWTVHDYGLDIPENQEYLVEMPKDGLVHLYTFDFSIKPDSDLGSPEEAFDRIYNEFCLIEGIYLVNGVLTDYSWSREEYGIESSRKLIKSVYDDRTGKDDYETKWEYVDELCDRAIEAMGGDKDAMFFGSGLNGSDFVVKGHYVDIMESKSDYNTPNDLWADVCTSLSMEKLLRITEAKDRKNYTLFIHWTGNGLMNSLNRNENSLRAVFGK